MNNHSHSGDHVDQLVDDFLTKVGEHCDSAVVLMSIPCDDCKGDSVVCFGVGSDSARFGMVHKYIAHENALQVSEIMTDILGPNRGED
jgi:hypothetical protein